MWPFRKKQNSLDARPLSRSVNEFHAADGGDLFATSALCGATAATEPNGILRLFAPGTAVTCATCRSYMLGGRP